jgi:hypothetical protein
LIIDSAGNLFGVTPIGGAANGTVFEVPAGFNNIVPLASFNIAGVGTNIFGGLIADSAGNLFGTSLYGGSTGGTAGTIYEVTGSGYVVAPEPCGLTLLMIAGTAFLAKRCHRRSLPGAIPN